jgi:hypothetical protein
MGNPEHPIKIPRRSFAESRRVVNQGLLDDFRCFRRSRHRGPHIDLIEKAIVDAQVVLYGHIEPRPRSTKETVARLIAMLDRVARPNGRPGMVCRVRP